MGWQRMDKTPRINIQRNKTNNFRYYGGTQNFNWGTMVPVGQCKGKRKYSLPSLNDRYGELTVIGYALGKGGTNIVVKCSCGYGPYRIVFYNLRNGKCLRCRLCHNKEFGKSALKFYGYGAILSNSSIRHSLLGRIAGAIARCHNTQDKGYKWYGKRGITVYAPWRKDRKKFLRYLISLEGWDNTKLELDRKNNNKGYKHGNIHF